MHVILRAALDWVHYRNHRDIRKCRLSVKAHAWLFTEHPSGSMKEMDKIMCFENLCMVIDLDPDTVRNWLRGLTVDEIRKLYCAK